MSKPKISVTLDGQEPCPLAAKVSLDRIDAERTCHLSRDMRPPTAIYNVSLSRLLPRVIDFCSSVEELYQSQNGGGAPEFVAEGGADRHLEHMFYAAAEHVDDIDNIASGFFKTHGIAKLDSRYKELKRKLDNAKKLTSTAANKIKHEQARVRLSALDVVHGAVPLRLYGYTIESVSKGVVGPNSAVHRVSHVHSLTAAAWDVLEFLVTAGNALALFLESFPKTQVERAPSPCDQFSQAVRAAVRLPAYTFGEPHAFKSTTFVFNAREDQLGSLNSGIYGSLFRPWSGSEKMAFGALTVTSEGDGSSKIFTLIAPKMVSIIRWGAPQID